MSVTEAIAVLGALRWVLVALGIAVAIYGGAMVTFWVSARRTGR